MANYNRVILVGNLVQSPELRYIPTGSAVTNFTLAINRVYTTTSNERKEETCFIPIVVWGKQAENCNQYLSKGSSVLVEGRLQQRSWETPEGQKRSIIEVVADRVQFLTKRNQEENQSAGHASKVETENSSACIESQEHTDEVPF